MRRLKPIVGALLLATITVSCSKKQDDYVRSAQDYITKRDYASALVQLKNAVAQTPNDAQVRMLMAEVFLHLGDVRSAEQELRRALALGSPREKVLPTLARTLLILGNPQRVVDEFKDETLADVDARAQLSSTVGVAHLELGDTRSAAETFNKILAEQPSNLSARVGNARVALLDRKYGEAGKQLAGILRDSPSAASALMLQAELQLAQGDRDAAMESYRRVGVANDKDIESRYRLGLLYLDSKQLPEASRLIEQIRAIAPKDLRADYLAAVAAWRQGQAAQAAELVTRVLARAPQHAPSMFLAGIAAQATGKAEAARNYLEKVRRHPLLGAQASRALIKTYLGSGEAAKAQEVVDEALTKAPKDPELLALAGEVALARGDMKKAGQVLSQAKEAQGSKARLAQTLIASGDATAGLNLLESEAEEGKEDEQSLITLAVYHLQHKNYDEALKRIRQFEAKQPKDALAPALRGVVLSSQSKPELARRELERALQLDAAHPLALDALASIDVREHKAGAAQARYEAVLRQQPGNETVALGYVAWLRAQNAGADKVLAVMRKLLVSNPDAVNARVAMVDLLLGYGEPGGAVQAAQELVGRKPDNAFALQLLAKAQLAAGNSEQALTSLRRVAEAQNSEAAWLSLADAAANAKNHTSAIAAARKALELHKGSIEAQQRLVRSFALSGQPDQALVTARQIQTEHPKEAIGFVLEADVLASQKRFAEAAVVLERALAAAPDASSAITKLHDVLVTSGQRREADTRLDAWLTRHDKNTTVRSYLAQRLALEGDYERSRTLLQQLVTLDPQDAVAFNNLAWVGARLKDPQALRHAQRAVALRPTDAAFLETLGSVLLDQDRVEEATRALRRSVELSPNFLGARLSLAKALLRAGDKVGAKTQLQRLLSAPESAPERKEAQAMLVQL